MENKIQETLNNITEKEDITILYSCESGSRAWGFPSVDSDYDVRFIYKRNKDQYLSIREIPDQLGYPINDELDIYGWDIKKVLKLLAKSNSTPFEWLQSPVIYREEKGFREGLLPLLPQYFSARKQAFHYIY